MYFILNCLFAVALPIAMYEFKLYESFYFIVVCGARVALEQGMPCLNVTFDWVLIGNNYLLLSTHFVPQGVSWGLQPFIPACPLTLFIAHVND